MIEITADHQAARDASALVATLARMNAGTQPAVIHIYDIDFALTDTVTATPLVSFELLKPAGTIASGVLTLTPPGDRLILGSGVAVRARCVNGAGLHCFDGDVSDAAGTGLIRLPDTQLYAGGVTRMTSGTLR